MQSNPGCEPFCLSVARPAHLPDGSVLRSQTSRTSGPASQPERMGSRQLYRSRMISLIATGFEGSAGLPMANYLRFVQRAVFAPVGGHAARAGPRGQFADVGTPFGNSALFLEHGIASTLAGPGVPGLFMRQISQPFLEHSFTRRTAQRRALTRLERPIFEMSRPEAWHTAPGTVSRHQCVASSSGAVILQIWVATASPTPG
ncbi:hypothetical protein JHW43_000071 [Diplocarpon mali]|nr:hypothetical protein JHW43_000071 [Diplocarpon mali]